MQNTAITRNKSIDYLRGLMAASIMIFHYTSWFVGKMDADNVLGRMGIYGVSIFYVLSGLTLYIVYKKSLNATPNSIFSFVFKRIFRIFPLLWLTITAAIVVKERHFPGWEMVLLNYTGLFGFLKPTAYIATGQWSIGNELVFYVFFPLLLILSKKSSKIFLFLIALSMALGIYFAFNLLTPEKTLSDQWATYVNPFNQLFLFTGGIFIGYISQYIDSDKYKSHILGLLLASILLFIFYPTGVGDRITIVTGFNRVLFVALSFLISFGFYNQKLFLHGWIDRFFTILGEASYSIYLLHPLVYAVAMIISAKLIKIPNYVLFPVCVVISISASYIIYKRIELPCIRMGKHFTNKYFPEKNKIEKEVHVSEPT